jgi:hypothetical protein
MNSHLVLTPTKREYPRHRATRPSRTQRFTLTYPVLQLRKHVICPLLSFVRRCSRLISRFSDDTEVELA